MNNDLSIYSEGWGGFPANAKQVAPDLWVIAYLAHNHRTHTLVLAHFVVTCREALDKQLETLGERVMWHRRYVQGSPIPFIGGPLDGAVMSISGVSPPSEWSVPAPPAKTPGKLTVVDPKLVTYHLDFRSATTKQREITGDEDYEAIYQVEASHDLP